MTTARPLNAAEQTELDEAISAAIRRLKSRADARPETLIAALHDYLDGWRIGRIKSSTHGRTLGIQLGALWGEQLVRALGWQWMSVQINGQGFFGVVSPEARWVAYPLNFLSGLTTHNDQANSTLLRFNMLVAQNIAPAQPGAYTPVV